MPSTLGAVLERQASAVVGRERERARLLDGAAAVTWVHGIAGSGKTALLRAFAVDAPAVTIDCRTVEPTEAGFLAALSRAAGVPADTVAAGAEALDGKVLVLDGFHGLPLLDMWLRMTFLPRLPASARAVIASREPPMAAWSADFGPLLRTLALGPLPPAAAEALLRRAGVPAAQARAVNRFAHGHPLSLVLAAAALDERPGRALAQTGVADTLARVYLEGLDADTRRALDAASVTRRVTLSLLGALLPGRAAARGVRAPSRPAVHRAGRRRARRPGHGARDRRRRAARRGSRRPPPPAGRRLAPPAGRDARRGAAGPVALHRGHAVPDRDPRGARHLLPDHRAPARPRARPPGGLGRDRGDRPRAGPGGGRRGPAALVGARPRGLRGRPRRHRGGQRLLLPVRPARRVPARDRRRPRRERVARPPAAQPAPARPDRAVHPRLGPAHRPHPAAGEPSICLDIKRTYLALRPALTRVYLPVADLAAGAEAFGPLGFTHAPGHEAQLGWRDDPHDGQRLRARLGRRLARRHGREGAAPRRAEPARRPRPHPPRARRARPPAAQRGARRLPRGAVPRGVGHRPPGRRQRARGGRQHAPAQARPTRQGAPDRARRRLSR